MKKLLTQAGLGLTSALFGLSAQATCLHVPASGMPAIFKGTTCTATATNVIAATVPSITSQNTVQQIPMPPNVAPPPLSSLKNIGVPSGPAAGFLYAFAGDNLSQGTPTSSPPPAPQPSCSCGGYAGTVYWSGWDSIGWKTTPGGCYACPPPVFANGSNSFTTGYGVKWDLQTMTACNLATGVCNPISETSNSAGAIVLQAQDTANSGSVVTQVISPGGQRIATYNTASNNQLAAAYNVTTGAAVTVNQFSYSGANVNGQTFNTQLNHIGTQVAQGVSGGGASSINVEGNAVGIWATSSLP